MHPINQLRHSENYRLPRSPKQPGPIAHPNSHMRPTWFSMCLLLLFQKDGRSCSNLKAAIVSKLIVSC